jgi:hypothetical protein
MTNNDDDNDDRDCDNRKHARTKHARTKQIITVIDDIDTTNADNITLHAYRSCKAYRSGVFIMKQSEFTEHDRKIVMESVLKGEPILINCVKEKKALFNMLNWCVGTCVGTYKITSISTIDTS